ncbi:MULTISPECIES: nucleoside-triphosphatase [unclassified Sedimentibacter]|uniref:nucleoside-triphosphatase n=1 Tax=unclassified Sedimentibacter TaxID=2649220 RepID=UPI0027DF11C0|nr:nucleoside-triphosphatase [Sedimentibacter sp. MB35-C1]WMJ78053.1 nucleoside-triphosphatase [Sedimentibacter sp. MB35-C1]
MIHALIVGPRHIGKTTLINSVLQKLGRPIYGYQTKKESLLSDSQMREPVYIYEPGKPRVQSTKNLLGYCSPTEGFKTMAGVFDAYAPKILASVPNSSVIVFDEIGFMESNEKQFCDAIISRLDGEVPVIAAVKNQKGFAFLEQVRTHPKCHCFYITEENRDALKVEVLKFMREQLKFSACASIERKK